MPNNSNHAPERHIQTVGAEFRMNDKNGKKTIEGYASVFDEPADLGWFTEYVRKTAFTKTIQESDIRALFNHNPDYVLGRNKAGTLELSVDSKGLFFSVQTPETNFARDLSESIARGDVSQCSFGFRTVKDNWFTEEKALSDGSKIKRDARELMEVQLFDVSPVTYPAYTQTSVSARNVGIDPEALVFAMWKTEKGLELSDEQRKLILNAKNRLEKIDVNGPDNHPDSEKPQAETFALLRSKLLLIEKSLI